MTTTPDDDWRPHETWPDGEATWVELPADLGTATDAEIEEWAERIAPALVRAMLGDDAPEWARATGEEGRKS